MGRTLGIDVGDRRIGLALSDSGGILASPLTIIEHTTEPGDIEAILKIAKEREAERIIVGLPRLMNGDIGPQAQKVQAFTESNAFAHPNPHRIPRRTFDDGHGAALASGIRV